MITVYILKSITGSYYIGQTQNFQKRLLDHNLGKSQSTKAGRPWTAVYKENFSSRAEAMLREKYLKSLKKRIALEKLILQ